MRTPALGNKRFFFFSRIRAPHFQKDKISCGGSNSGEVCGGKVGRCPREPPIQVRTREAVLRRALWKHSFGDQMVWAHTAGRCPYLLEAGGRSAACGPIGQAPVEGPTRPPAPTAEARRRVCPCRSSIPRPHPDPPDAPKVVVGASALWQVQGKSPQMHPLLPQVPCAALVKLCACHCWVAGICFKNLWRSQVLPDIETFTSGPQRATL